MPETEFLLEMKKITKRFSSNTVLDEVDFSVRQGEVHALIGENGAGKSTLMKILCGVYHADDGSVLIQGEKQKIKNPAESIALGISIINQEMSPMRDLTVAENIFMGRLPMKNGFIDKKTMNKMAQLLLDEIGSKIDPSQYMNSLKISDMQMVEICKAISFDAKIIIMDEPTSALSEKEVEALFQIINNLKSKGKSIIYISHKLDEIFAICDSATILRDGKLIDRSDIKDLTKDQMISSMVGRKIEDIFPPRHPKFGDIMLSIRDYQTSPGGPKISFDLRKGEVLGLTGLMGAGRTELAETIFGMRKRYGGVLKIEDKEVTVNNPLQAMKSGIAFCTDDRKLTGLVGTMSIKENITLPTIQDFFKGGMLSYKKEIDATNRMMEMLRIKATSYMTNVMELSGGNQQKVVLAKWLYREPKILILDEPTRGIDVGAKVEIYNVINELTDKGYSILFISSEMQEIIGVCDRVLIFHEGDVNGELNRAEFNQEYIMRCASGL